MLKPWPLLSSELEQKLRIFDVRAERYLSPRTGQPYDAFVLECCDWVNAVALTPDGQVVLLRQFRFGSGELSLEIPGGLIDPGETPLQAARRELREETGYEAERWTALGSIAPNPAIQRNRLHCFLAEGCRVAGAPEPDAGEDLEVVLEPVAAVPGLLASGAISHALVAIAFQRLDLLRAGHTFG